MCPNLGHNFVFAHSYERMKPLLKISKRCIALLMALVLVLGTVPTAFAAETTTEPTITTESTITTDPTETTEATEPTQATTEAMEPTTEDTTLSDTPALMTASDDYGIMTAATTQSSIMLFDFSDNCNYTSSQSIINGTALEAQKPAI